MTTLVIADTFHMCSTQTLLDAELKHRAPSDRICLNFMFASHLCQETPRRTSCITCLFLLPGGIHNVSTARPRRTQTQTQTRPRPRPSRPSEQTQTQGVPVPSPASSSGSTSDVYKWQRLLLLSTKVYLDKPSTTRHSAMAYDGVSFVDNFTTHDMYSDVDLDVDMEAPFQLASSSRLELPQPLKKGQKKKKKKTHQQHGVMFA